MKVLIDVAVAVLAWILFMWAALYGYYRNTDAPLFAWFFGSHFIFPVWLIVRTNWFVESGRRGFGGAFARALLPATTHLAIPVMVYFYAEDSPPAIALLAIIFFVPAMLLSETFAAYLVLQRASARVRAKRFWADTQVAMLGWTLLISLIACCVLDKLFQLAGYFGTVPYALLTGVFLFLCVVSTHELWRANRAMEGVYH